MRPIRFWLSCFLVATLSACGSGGSDPPGASPPAPSPSPPPASNPCDVAAGTAGEEPTRPPASSKAVPGVDGDPRWSLLDSLWLHRSARDRGVIAPLAGPGRLAMDVGEIAVIEDAGDLIVRPNLLDLAEVGLDFRPAASGYTVTRASGTFRQAIGSRLTLQDDDAAARDLPFTFPYYGAGRTRVFINSDGNLTFEQRDIASTMRSVSRFLTGPPRLAPFFADLDPSVGSGGVFYRAGADGVTVTWCGVRGFDVPESATFQASLLTDGSVEFRYGARISLPDAVVGVSPGRTGNFSAVDLTASTGGRPSGAGAIGERFSEDPSLDLVSVARRFYESHGDDYEQLVIWTNARVVSGDTFAFETTVANEIRGLGTAVFDSASDFGSRGRLRSLVVMDNLGKYPGDPARRVFGENSTLTLLAHETGHRWLSFLRFREADGQLSDELLGRAQAHWSFFFDSDGSVMEGNDIEDLGGGEFRTVGAVSRYSLVDQYAMGLVGETDVRPMFYVEAPTNIRPERDREANPEIGVRFTGTRRQVRIEDIVDAMGVRQPSFRSSPKVHRQAFIYVISDGSAVIQAQIDKLDRIRREWPAFFNRATSGRMRVEVELR